MDKNVFLNFKHIELKKTRQRLLKDISQESYAMALCKKSESNNNIIIKVIDIFYPEVEDYIQQRGAFLEMSENFASKVVYEASQRLDVDTILEIHTHPFMDDKPMFSSVDTSDEKQLSRWLLKELPNYNYGSLVFSRMDYNFRMWIINNQVLTSPLYGEIKAQTNLEHIPRNENQEYASNDIYDAIHNRGYLALGKDTIRDFSMNQHITIVGVGGIGSIIAENLIHMGFQNLHLIDHDNSEISNLNRVAGLYYEDAKQAKPKVDVVKKHLERINPNINIKAYQTKVEDETIRDVIAISNWVILATDNHSSRFLTQSLCFEFFVPFISVGVHIHVDNKNILDMSGEVITIRMGDHFCLKCLNRLDYNEIAKELSSDENVRKGLIEKGYVTGDEVKEPAVKTLNAIMGALTVDQLINQYTHKQRFEPVIVYENNAIPKIYADHASLHIKTKLCDVCDI